MAESCSKTIKKTNDKTTTISELKEFMAEFIKERNWDKHHNPKSLSMSIAIEAAELMEKFQFCDNEESKIVVQKDKKEIERELVDILSYMLSFANMCDIDISSAYSEKMELNAQKYPVEKITGTFENYRAVKRSLKCEE